MQKLTQWVGRQPASLPLISPSHPLLMFSTESEPCRMCTETSAGATRSTLLLPGRGSDYIWSINTHWLWEALCLSLFLCLFSPSRCLRLPLPNSCSLTTGWHLVTICQAICLWCHIFLHYIRVCVNNALHLSIHPFSHLSWGWTVVILVSLLLWGGVILLFRCSHPLPPCWRKGVNCGVVAATVDSCLIHRSAQSSILISQESIDIWVRHVSPKGWDRRPCLQMWLP